MKKLTVDGITFETTKEAKAAERELEAIDKIRGRMDVTNPIYAKVLYEKLIEKEMLHTKVGDKFLAELQGYFDPEAAVKQAADTGSAQKDAGTAGTAETAATETSSRQEEGSAIPYLDETAQGKTGQNETAAEEYPQEADAAAAEEAPREAEADMAEEDAQKIGAGSEEQLMGGREDEADISGETLFGADFADMPDENAGKNRAGGVSSDTARLEGLLHGAIFEGKGPFSFSENAGGAEKTGADTVSEEDLTEEYFGATGLDALVEEYDEADAGAEKGAGEKQSEGENAGVTGGKDSGDTADPDEADLDAFMKEYGLTDFMEADFGSDEAEKPEEKADEAELDALMKEYGVTQTEEPKSAEAAGEQTEEEDEEISPDELDALVGEYDEEQAQAATEPPLNLDIGEKEEVGGQEAGGFRLELDNTDLYDGEPDDDMLLAQARTLKKELHQEDLSEVFSDRDEQPEKKHFSLYGVLIVSLILNVVLVASMAIMVQVFKNSDNRNILNYERIMEQEYQTQEATPTDAE